MTPARADAWREDGAPPPAVLVEIQDVIGPQEGTRYVDATGAACGETVCLVCSRKVVVAYASGRQDGERPILVEARRHPRGPWRLYRKAGLGPDVILAEFDGDNSPYAEFVNHRITCPAARVP